MNLQSRALVLALVSTVALAACNGADSAAPANPANPANPKPDAPHSPIAGVWNLRASRGNPLPTAIGLTVVPVNGDTKVVNIYLLGMTLTLTDSTWTTVDQVQWPSPDRVYTHTRYGVYSRTNDTLLTFIERDNNPYDDGVSSYGRRWVATLSGGSIKAYEQPWGGNGVAVIQTPSLFSR